MMDESNGGRKRINDTFEDLLSKRRKLLDLREKAMQSQHQFRRIEKKVSDELDKEPTVLSSKQDEEAMDEGDEGEGEDNQSGVSKQHEQKEVANAICEDYDSDDSVKDKTYEPEEDNSSCESHVSGSPEAVTKSRKNAVKRQIFTPQKPSRKQQLHDLDLITPEELFGSKLPESTYQGDFLNNNVDNNIFSHECPSEKIFITTKSQVHYNDKMDNSYKDLVSLSNTSLISKNLNPAYSILTVDEDGIIYLPDVDQQGHKIEENRQNMLCKKQSFQNCTEPENNVNLLTPFEDGSGLELDESLQDDKLSYHTMTVDSNGVVYLTNTDQTNIHLANETQITHDSTPIKKKAKKKEKNVMKWKRVASKVARLKGSPYHSTVAKKKLEVEGRIVKPPCSCRAKCFEKLSYEERKIINHQFWKQSQNWDQRRQFIIDNVIKTKKRMMRTDGNFDSDKRKYTYTYQLVANLKTVKVCKVMFTNTLSIGEKIIKVSFEKRLESGLTDGDKRGRHAPANKTPEPIVQQIMDHINAYPCYESHYSRQKSSRKFLGSELNISIMYKQYKETMIEKGTPLDLIAKEWIYRNIFNTKFNLSFKLPSVDTCDDCDAFTRQLEDVQDEEEKKAIEIRRDAHKELSDERYNLKRIDKEEAKSSLGKKRVLMFDLQQCMPTPCLTNAKSFYLRKLWTLNLTMYDSTEKTATNLIWSENISGRGGNDVTSCIIRWAEENSASLCNVEDLTLWSDNCPGQNRNMMNIMGYMWLMHIFPQLKVINHKYMLKGHTHMEVDTIHSQIERKKKALKTMQIATPRDWSQFIRTCGGKKAYQVYDMELQHFKDFSALFKKNGPFVARKKKKKVKTLKYPNACGYN